MRKIEEIYKVAGSTLEKIDMDTLHPADLILVSSPPSGHVGTTYMAVVLDMERKEKITVDLLAMITMTTLVDDCLMKVTECDEDWEPGDPITADWEDITWEIMGECITDKLVAGYQKTLPDFSDGERSLRFCQVLHTEDFECSYCLLGTPEDRNVKFRRWQLLDMAITKMNQKNPIQLENCLLSVNGCLSRPIMFKDELLMARGAEWIHNNTMEKLPSVTLIDFTNLGGITIIPFSDCTYKVRTNKGEGLPERGFIVPGRTIEIILPEWVDLSKKHLWMVLGHSLFFEESMRISTTRSVTIAPSLLSLEHCLLKSQYHAAKYYQDTEVFSAGESVTEYINDTAWLPDHYGAFFVLINTQNLYMRKTHTQQYAKERMHVAVPNTEGLIWDDIARSIVDHTRAAYRTYTDFYAMPMDHYIRGITTADFDSPHEATENIHPWFHKWLDPMMSNMYVMEVIRA